jgi:DNA-binding transcriptional LysR family regulator
MDKRESVQDSNDDKSTMLGHIEAMPTNMRGIEIFVRIVESGSFVAAARSLLIDPAAVSRAVKGLEEDLGISLVVRSTRAFKLTTEGARFYRDGAQLLRTFDDTIDRFRADTALHGQLKVGMGPALSRPTMLRAIASFQTLHPDVRLVLISVNDPAQVGDEGLDVFIRPRSLRQRGGEHKQQQGTILRKLFYSPMVTAASPAYLKRMGVPRTPAGLAAHSCTALLTLERDVQDEWKFVRRNRTETVRFSPKLVADGEALREAALAGCGVIRVLAWEIADPLQSGALLQLLPDWECLGGLPIIAIYRKTRSTRARINALLQHLTGEFRAHDNVVPRAGSSPA